MLYITGDTHGNQLKWLEQIHPALSPGDGVIVAGDFGYGFWSGPLGSEDAFYDWLAAQPYAVFFIDGNHENFDRLLALPVEPWRGGRIQRIRPNVIHLMRGEVYLIEGRTVFTFGGGHSADFWRRKPGASWWPQEMPEPEEYRRASESLRRVHGRVDYIVTHAAPLETGYYLSALHQYPPAAAGGTAAHELSRGRAPCDGLSPLVLWPPPHRSGALVARAGRGI